MRGSIKKSIVLFAIWLSSSLSVFADCKTLLRNIENERLKKVVDFALESPGRPVIVKGFPIHFTSNRPFEFVWLTSPVSDATYFVAQKNDRGFGFSAGRAEPYHLVNHPGTTLRSLDFSGTGDHLLASLVMTDLQTGHQGVVFKLVDIKDPETGELQIAPLKGLALEDIAETGKNFVVSSRPETNEFWLTDGSNQLRVIGVDAEAETISEVLRLTLPKEIKRATKVQFFGDGSAGYIRGELASGEWAMIPFILKIEPIMKKATAKSSKTSEEPKLVGQKIKLQYLLAAKYVIESDYVRTAVHPIDPVVIVAYKDRIEAIGWNLESEKFEKVLSEKINFLRPGEEVLGIDFFWQGEILKEEGAEEAHEGEFYGRVQGALLVGENNRAQTRLYWLDFRNGSSPAAR